MAKTALGVLRKQPGYKQEIAWESPTAGLAISHRTVTYDYCTDYLIRVLASDIDSWGIFLHTWFCACAFYQRPPRL